MSPKGKEDLYEIKNIVLVLIFLLQSTSSLLTIKGFPLDCLSKSMRFDSEVMENERISFNSPLISLAFLSTIEKEDPYETKTKIVLVSIMVPGSQDPKVPKVLGLKASKKTKKTKKTKKNHGFFS